ncbi:MAG: DnaJ domain-containing protein [Gammaproteobacteria bacterium]|nr:DnaJ domain-containing protein [Gammaproteobacteria bacterium]
MSNERRNYYRVLHVQPEAPAEIITASYRSMMTKLRHHPDLGGDHDTAAMINQAYAVLSNPDKRAEYDRSRRSRTHAAAGRGQREQVAGVRPAARKAGPLNVCAYCRAVTPTVIDADTRCGRCEAPLAPVAHRFGRLSDSAGRRASARVAKDEVAMVHYDTSKTSARARMRDLSANGISFYTAAPVKPNTVVRIVTPAFDVVGQVVRVRPSDQISIVHARLVTAAFAGRTSVFVSISV